MTRNEIANVLAAAASSTGFAHSAEFRVWDSRAEVILHHRLPESARRKMRRRFAQLVAGEGEPPTLRIKTHRLAVAASG